MYPDHCLALSCNKQGHSYIVGCDKVDTHTLGTFFDLNSPPALSGHV